MIFERFFPAKKPAYQLWTSASYFNLTTELDKNTLEQSLTWDVIAFLHEYVGLKAKKIYPYGPFGILNSYHQRTVDLCRNQEQVIKEKGGNPIRAQLETWVAQELTHWMADPTIPLGEKLVIISPRGTLDEGYPGLDQKNYVFINIYEKLGQNDFQLVQYTSYAPETALLRQQQTMQAQLPGYQYLPTTHPPLPNRNLTLSQKIISHLLCLPAPTKFTDLENIIYQQEKQWRITRQQLPQVPEDRFAFEITRAVSLLLEQFWLLTEASPQLAVQHFDELVKVLREHFLKWVEHHAHNYHVDGNLAPYALNLEQILENWHLNLKSQSKTLARPEQRKLEAIHKTVALNTLQPLLRASSVAHCVVGTPGSLTTQLLKLNPNILMVGSVEFRQLSWSDQRSLLIRIASEQMVEMNLGKGEIWMVPHSFLAGNGCYLSPEGVALGPCDVPLAESFAFKMSALEFAQFLAELEQTVDEEELNNLAHDETLMTNLDSAQTTELQQKIAMIKNLILKPVVSITELLSGDVVKSFHQNLEISKLIHRLKSSGNPLFACEEIIAELLEDRNGVLKMGEV